MRGSGMIYHHPPKSQVSCVVVVEREELRTHRVASLWDEVWQKRNRSSLRDLLKAYFADILLLTFFFFVWKELGGRGRSIGV